MAKVKLETIQDTGQYIMLNNVATKENIEKLERRIEELKRNAERSKWISDRRNGKRY